MAKKPFEIQGQTLKIGGTELNSSTDGKIVIPGVTRATGYQAYEVEDTDDDQTQTWNRRGINYRSRRYNTEW